MADAEVLNARVGRVLPNPLFGAPTGRHPDEARDEVRRRWHALRSRLPRAVGPLLLLLAALWPHGLWLARRLTDGSDEPWGALALLTVLALVLRERRELVLPARRALLASGVLALLAATLTLIVPPIFAAATAMMALAAFITSALPRRPAAPLATMLLLALPVIASLQFYLGYPLRLATAHAAVPLLALAGLDVQAAGAALVFGGQTILVDPPCAGIGMLWVGSWAAALLSYLNEADTRRTFVNGCVAAMAVFGANVLRNALLFFPESGLVSQPDGLHAAIGLLAFAVALGPVIVFTSRRPAGSPRSRTAPPLRRGSAAGHTPAARARSFFVGACLAAAVLPPLGSWFLASGATGREPAAAVDPRSTSIEWPTHFRGQPLTQLPPTALEARFATRFPGAVARFTDGEQLLVVRHVRRPTRLLHPASDCFRGAGYRVGAAAAAVDAHGVRWRCFVATQGAEHLRVCERIAERLDDADPGWTDVSAWFWDAQFARAATAWWALTVVTPLGVEAGS